MANEYNLPWLQQGNNMDSVPEWMYPYLQQTSWYNQPTPQTTQPIVNQGMFGGSGDDTGLVSFENPVPMTYEEQKADWANMQPGQEMFLSLIPGAMQLGNSYYDRPWDAGIYGGLTAGGNSGKGLFGGFFDNLFGGPVDLYNTGNNNYWDNYSEGIESDGYTDLGDYGYDTYSGMGGDVGSESPGGTGAGSMDSSGGSYSADDAGDAAAESDWT